MKKKANGGELDTQQNAKEEDAISKSNFGVHLARGKRRVWLGIFQTMRRRSERGGRKPRLSWVRMKPKGLHSAVLSQRRRRDDAISRTNKRKGQGGGDPAQTAAEGFTSTKMGLHT